MARALERVLPDSFRLHDSRDHDWLVGASILGRTALRRPFERAWRTQYENSNDRSYCVRHLSTDSRLFPTP